MGLVTSPYPSAKIKRIDVSQAEAAGFITLTAAELPAFNYYGGSGRPFAPLSHDMITFAGQPVVAVASSDPNGVTDAINLVHVDYEPQPYVFDVEAALSSGAPQVYEGGNSIIGPKPIINADLGDVDGALANADVVVGPIRYDTAIYTHFELEGQRSSPGGPMDSCSPGRRRTTHSETRQVSRRTSACPWGTSCAGTPWEAPPMEPQAASSETAQVGTPSSLRPLSQRR